MAHGHLMLLSPHTITELLLSDPNHPRLRRHHACVNIIQDYRCNTSITKISPSCSYSIPPTVFKQICLHYNTHVLFRSTDLQISTIGLWRIFVRSSVEPSFLSLCRKSRLSSRWITSPDDLQDMPKHRIYIGWPFCGWNSNIAFPPWAIRFEQNTNQLPPCDLGSQVQLWCNIYEISTMNCLWDLAG